jgi:hypothetical protein
MSIVLIVGVALIFLWGMHRLNINAEVVGCLLSVAVAIAIAIVLARGL